MSNAELKNNSAALREALESCLNFIVRIDRAFNPYMQGLLEDAVAKAKAALAEPARNCDRFDEYHDAVDAWHREERCLGHHQDGGTCEKDPLASTLAPVCFARWFLSKAEGKEVDNV